MEYWLNRRAECSDLHALAREAHSHCPAAAAAIFAEAEEAAGSRDVDLGMPVPSVKELLKVMT